MKKKIILKAITIALFLVALFLNLKISLNNDHKLLLNLNSLSKVAAAEEEGVDKYVQELVSVEIPTYCSRCYSDPFGRVEEQCQCEVWAIYCWPDPNGSPCQGEEWVEIFEQTCHLTSIPC